MAGLDPAIQGAARTTVGARGLDPRVKPGDDEFRLPRCYLQNFFRNACYSALIGGWIYIVTNKRNGTLYTGVTSNLARRAWEHRTSAVYAHIMGA